MDIQEIMGRIRERVRAELSQNLQNGAGAETWWEDRNAENRQSLEANFTPLVHNPELYTLNTTYAGWFQMPVVTSHRRFLGRLLVKWKTYIFDLIGKQLFGDYLRREQEFQIQLVRFLNAVATHVDSRDERLFWQVMHKVDSDVQALNQRADVLYDEAVKSVAALTEQVRRQKGAQSTPAHERWNEPPGAEPKEKL